MSKINLSKTCFLNPKIRVAFTYLSKAFTEAPILQHFNPECNIWIETDKSGFTINGIYGWRNLRLITHPNPNLSPSKMSQWHPIAFFSRKMILANIWYEIHNWKFLAIVEILKTWRLYLEACKYEVFVFTNYNHLHQLINIKILSRTPVQ